MAGACPNLASAIRKLSRYLENPMQSLWIAAMRMHQYIGGTCYHGIMFRETIKLNLPDTQTPIEREAM